MYTVLSAVHSVVPPEPIFFCIKCAIKMQQPSFFFFFQMLPSSNLLQVLPSCQGRIVGGKWLGHHSAIWTGEPINIVQPGWLATCRSTQGSNTPSNLKAVGGSRHVDYPIFIYADSNSLVLWVLSRSNCSGDCCWDKNENLLKNIYG